ncbi:hypothetical protein [Nocardia donostiensis]|uniref:hypothetical protein n=1 Tax=Nocardia donostiensis TaxID=1538463 RepID=UPI00111599C4|nr:hypothetical protein [Nocardia donostiensis]
MVENAQGRWAIRVGHGRFGTRVPGVFGVIGGLVATAAIAMGCGGEISQRDRECELLRTVTVAGFTRQSVDTVPGDGAHCPREFYFGPAFGDVREVVNAPGLDPTSNTRPPYPSHAGSTSIVLGFEQTRCHLDARWYGRTAVLDPWLGLTDEQRLAIRGGTSVVIGVSVSCYSG